MYVAFAHRDETIIAHVILLFARRAETSANVFDCLRFELRQVRMYLTFCASSSEKCECIGAFAPHPSSPCECIADRARRISKTAGFLHLE